MINECYDNGVSATYRRCQSMILKHAPLLMKAGDAADRPRFTELELNSLRRSFSEGLSTLRAATECGRKQGVVKKLFREWRKHGAT